MGPISERIAAAFDTVSVVSLADDERIADLGQAEEICDGAMRRLGDVAGWKLGATIASVRAELGLSSQFFGPLPERRMFGDGATLNAVQARLHGVECEYGFRLARDVRPEDADLPEPDFLELFDTVHPAFEIPGSRFSTLGVHGGLGLVADLGAAGAVVVGQGRPYRDLRRLDAASVQLFVDGTLRASGSSERIDGGAFGPLQAFIRSAIKRGYFPRAGQIVVTGSCTGYTILQSGVEVLAVFEALDQKVRLRFTDET